ncbi:MAG: FG-GAP-like repeat-containing protein [bacterium]
MLHYLILTTINNASSQNYFDINNKKNVPIGPVNSVPILIPIYFGLQEVTSSYLDVTTSFIAQFPVMSDGIGCLTPNSGGIGSFGNYSTFFFEHTHLPNYINIYGNVFVKLRASVSQKDFVIARNNGLQVHWNSIDSITGVKQSIVGLNPTIIEGGSFNFDDNIEDVAIKDGSSIKIFKNLSNGYLDTNPFSFPIYTENFKLKQMDVQIDGYPINDPNNRADLIVLDSVNRVATIKIYLNNNNNSFNISTPFAVIHPGLVIKNFEVSDIDNDGYNDIIIAGVDGPVIANYYFVKVYKNYQGTIIGSEPICSIESPIYIRQFPRLSITDLNKDGLNDLITVSNGGYTNVFINKNTIPIFNSVPDQIFSIISNPLGNIWQIKTGDIYNTRGIALFASYQSVGFGQNPPPPPTDQDGGIFAVNALNYNPAPPPPILTGQVHFDGTYYRPKIVLNNRGERDFLRYDIYKFSPSTGGQIVLVGSTSSDVFIDNSEYILYSQFGDVPWWNCYYYAKEVDQTSQASINSKYAYYTVGLPCIACADGSDNINSQPEYVFEDPKEYNLTNFPNPFNPVTKIYFTVPKDGNVKITIYNSLGQKVKEILNEVKKVGIYTIDFDGNNFSSGIYYYRMEAKNFIATKKMLLIK